jgi:DNA-binding transcriptional MocR family regulator
MPRSVSWHGLNCSSFSKSLAPGYRVGWVAAGRFATDLQRRKVMSSLSTSAPAQDAIALYLREGGYERHLSGLRRALAAQKADARGRIQHCARPHLLRHARLPELPAPELRPPLDADG